MANRIRAAGALAAVVVVSISLKVKGAPSAEINPFAGTYDQVNARMARVQQEVDRLRAAGMFAAADDMNRRLAHFHGELGGIEPSLVSGPELDAVGMYTANGDTPIVEVRPSDRPIVLALGAYELVHWQLQVFPGANLQKVIVSGYDGAAVPAGVPAGVPVEVTSYTANGGGNYFYFYSKGETSFANAAKMMYEKTGLPPSSMQSLHAYLGQHFAVGAGDEWKQERVLSEMQPLYKDATAFQLAQDRAAADGYRFWGLYSTYRADGSQQSTHVAQMTPLQAIPGTIAAGSADYNFLAVDPRGPSYYGFHFGRAPVKFDAASGAETAMPSLSNNVLSAVSGLTFDTKRNRVVLSSHSGEGAGGFWFYSPGDLTWLHPSSGGQVALNESSLTYSPVNDAYFSVESGANGGLKLDRYDAGTLAKTQLELSQFITCGRDTCQLAASGDRLALIVPPSVDIYEPLSGPVVHSYLINPGNGNVTILGALPEPGWMMGVMMTIVALMGRRKTPHPGPLP